VGTFYATIGSIKWGTAVGAIRQHGGLHTGWLEEPKASIAFFVPFGPKSLDTHIYWWTAPQSEQPSPWRDLPDKFKTTTWTTQKSSQTIWIEKWSSK